MRPANATNLFLAFLAIGVALTGCRGKSHAGGEEATLDELNRALAVMSMSSRTVPTNVHQLTNFPSLQGKRLPEPPAGKKLVIDRTNQAVVFVNQ